MKQKTWLISPKGVFEVIKVKETGGQGNPKEGATYNYQIVVKEIK